MVDTAIIKLFQSTPSVWRETIDFTTFKGLYGISIHSLRVEGDDVTYDFDKHCNQFQSTPSVWRETAATIFPSTSARTFQSTPSVWRETVKEISTIYQKVISIHSLRVEGDLGGNS